MLKAGVIGHPISHSKSPLIHGYWLKKYRIDGEYKTYDIPPDSLEKGIDGLVHTGLKGFNVTLPHKQAIIPMCHSLSDEASAIGAVNTITVHQDGTLHGHNTDAFGFSQNLEETVIGFDWTKAPAVVIGAGGAARAILHALRSKDVPEIRITNRTRESADRLAKPYGATVIDWEMRDTALTDAGLVINTTSLGMTGQDPLQIDLTTMADKAVVYDIVYTPLITPLLRQAEEKGARIVTGIGMLLHQARPGFNAWFGHFPDVSQELEDLLRKA